MEGRPERSFENGDRKWDFLSWLLLGADGIAFCFRYYEFVMDSAYLSFCFDRKIIPNSKWISYTAGAGLVIYSFIFLLMQ